MLRHYVCFNDADFVADKWLPALPAAGLLSALAHVSLVSTFDVCFSLSDLSCYELRSGLVRSAKSQSSFPTFEDHNLSPDFKGIKHASAHVTTVQISLQYLFLQVGTCKRHESNIL